MGHSIGCMVSYKRHIFLIFSFNFQPKFEGFLLKIGHILQYYRDDLIQAKLKVNC